jgi:endonuclease/exonuclease/phosphatase (EEP) superfamily protein YafD
MIADVLARGGRVAGGMIQVALFLTAGRGHQGLPAEFMAQAFNSAKFGLYLLRSLAVFVCMATVLPLLRTDEWWIRILDFPRMQIAVLGSALILGGVGLRKHCRPADGFMLGAVGLAVLAQLIQMLPYTPLANQQVVSASAEHSGPEFRLIAFNVFQFNRRADALLDLVNERQPDVVLLTEVDPWWVQQAEALRPRYPHVIQQPQTNTYGMALYSRFELIEPQVRFLIEPDVPSIRTRIKLSGDRTLVFYGVHPKPPGVKSPQGTRPDSGRRDAELILIAKEVQALNEPVMVAGDFNDVAWSHTTRLFQRTARLLDPRIGRGLYNTWHARYAWMRFPVDHIFHSEHFVLAGFERLLDFGSDHFPVWVALRLAPEAPRHQEPPERKRGDPQDVEETQ